MTTHDIVHYELPPAPWRPMVQGGVEVATPPNSAGRRGRVTTHDWDEIAAELARRPGRTFCYRDIVVGDLDRLKKRYPQIEFLGQKVHLLTLGDNSTQRVQDVYVSLKGTTP